MAYLKRTVTFSADGTKSVGLGARYAKVSQVRLKSSSDASVAVTGTDAASEQFLNIASGDFTTQARRYLQSDPDLVIDADATGAAAVATNDGFDSPIIKGPAAIAITGLAAGTFTVELYVEV